MVAGRPVESCATSGRCAPGILDPMVTPSLWRHPEFMKLWAGQTVSELGSVVTRTAIPLLALLVLGAGPTEMAFLVVAGSLAVLLVGLIAGAWVDRLPRRPVLILADLVRAVVLVSIPVAYVANVLRIEQLYVVVFVEGCLGSFFGAAYPAYVPSLIGVDRVVEGNSRLATSSSVAEIGGPALGGGLVQLVGGPLAILVDAISFVVSAISLLLIRTREPRRPSPTARDADPPRDRRGTAARRAPPNSRPAGRPVRCSPMSRGRSTASSTRSTWSTSCTWTHCCSESSSRPAASAR